MGYDFPGNVRELRNLLEVACAYTPDGAELSLSAIPDEFNSRLCVGASAKQDSHIHIQDLRKALHSFEASVISARLRHFQGNRRLVAQSLNIPKRTLDHKCQKLEVS
jgi:sigma-54-specific transcriptional regulator